MKSVPAARMVWPAGVLIIPALLTLRPINIT
jgi:hypothetical protein